MNARTKSYPIPSSNRTFMELKYMSESDGDSQAVF